MAFKPEATIYTDGSCAGNPGPGGWAAVVIINGEERSLSGGDAYTTNNIMELTGVITALESLRGPHIATVISDSQYVTNAFNKGWIKKWKANGWARNEGELKNKELWQKLDKLVEKHSCIFKWVKGHDGNRYNELCDRMAVAQTNKFAHNIAASAEGEEDRNGAEGITSPTFSSDLVLKCLNSILHSKSVAETGTEIPCAEYPWCEFCTPDEANCCACAYVRYST